MKSILKILMPVEWLLLVFAAAIYFIYNYFSLQFPGGPGSQANQGPLLFYIKQVLTAADLYALALVLFVMVKFCKILKQNNFSLKKYSWGSFKQETAPRFYLGELFQDMRFMNAVLLMFVLFALLKNLIPIINPALYDQFFFDIDRLICQGKLCSELAVSILGNSAEMQRQVSEHYFWYYPYLSILTLIFIVAASRNLAQEYFCCLISMFLFGTLWIYLLPTWGPVYFKPELFEFMKDSQIGKLQQGLWQMKTTLETNPANKQAVFMISGFPSLHVAVVLAGSLYLQKVNRLAAVISWFFLVLTLNSTIYLGWHYFLDDLGSVFLVMFSICLARKFKWEWGGFHPKSQ